MSKNSIVLSLAVLLFIGSVTPMLAVNMLRNPSLETWTTIRQPQYWTVEDTTACKVYKESTNKFHGNYSAKLQRMVVGTGNNKGIMQQCTIPGRGRYIARARFLDNTDSVSGGLTITWRTSTGTFISSWSTSYTTNSATWQVVERNATTDTAPTGAGLADFLVRVYGVAGASAGKIIYVDSCFFEWVSPGIEETSLLTNIQSFNVSPNPFNTTTQINFAVTPNTFHTVKIYDAAGNVIRTLSPAINSSGSYKIIWDGRNDEGLLSAPGIYFVVLKSDNTEAKAIKTLFLR